MIAGSSLVDMNYNATKREALGMIYVIQKVHDKLNSIGKIKKKKMLFQEYDFEIFVKPRKAHVGLDHFSKIKG